MGSKRNASSPSDKVNPDLVQSATGGRENGATTATVAQKHQSNGTAGGAGAAGPQIMPKIARLILDKVPLSRLTIVIGPTGSGKSTGIPPLLLDGLGGPILCTQPRRLAVFAIAKRVASQKDVELGSEEVGFHVGNHNLSTRKTKLLFTTAGILLEELRANGIQALTRFKCVVIDECHERSPESDLVLGLIKQFMVTKPKANIRIILMSATFDHARYKEFFTGVPGCETIDTITLETAASFDSFHSMVDTYYLEDVARQIPSDATDEMRPWLRKMRMDPTEDLEYDDGRTLSPGLVSFARELVLWLDSEEPKRSPFLIFAPTYRHLEQLYDMMMLSRMDANLSVLHSSVDIEDCLRSMMESNNDSRRHIFLASAIADSSITVPGVSCVIDLCRTLEVRWENRTHHARTIWASKSICDQRRGRTGRTCPGRVFRLVPKGFYIASLPNWDVAQLTLSSCHNEVLKVICSTHGLADSPRKLLSGCLDAPDASVVNDAIAYLSEIGACIEKTNTKHLLGTGGTAENETSVVPTPYGSLLGSLPVTVAEAKIILAGATIGLVYETLALQAIHSQKPSPIVQVFGEEDSNLMTMQSFYHKANSTDAHATALAHLSAFLFWDVEWNHRRRHRTVAGLMQGRAATDILPWTPRLEEEHVEWCRQYKINPTSVRSISELIENTMAVFFLEHHEPDWLRCTDPTPLWKRPADWRGPLIPHGREMFQRVYGQDANVICDALRALCVSRGDASKATHLVQKLPGMALLPGMEDKLPKNNEPEACIYFLMGTCKYGNKCTASHSPFARRPLCRFYQNGNCTRGDTCIYSHGDEEDKRKNGNGATKKNGANGATKQDPMLPMLPLREEYMVFGEDPLSWFATYHKVLCMLGEGNFKFSSVLGQKGCPPALSTCLETDGVVKRADRWFGVDATRLHEYTRFAQSVQSHHVRAFAWNYPFTGQDEDTASNEFLLLQMFQSTAYLLQHVNEYELLPELYLALTLQQDQFSRWNVMKSAYLTGWRFTGWCEFEPRDFAPYKPTRASGITFPATASRFYTFKITKHDLPRYNVM